MIKIISAIGYLFAFLVNKTLKVQRVCSDFWKDIAGPVIFAFYHGEQFILYHQHRRQKVAIMTSLSRDGEIQSNILKSFGYIPVRGSSTYKGERALVEMIRLVRAGFSCAFAVDGPKGPIYQVKPGIILLAQKTKRPIVPVSAASKNHWLLSKTWDKYRLPKPFSQAVVVYGPPLLVGAQEDLEEKRKQLENSLRTISEFANQHYWTENISEYLFRHFQPKVLIIKPSGIGDIVHSLPVAIAFKKIFPNSKLHWLVFSKFADVLKNENYIDQILLWKREGGLKEYLRVLKNIRQQNYDVVIDLQVLQRTALLNYFSSARWKLAASLSREFAGMWVKPVKKFNPEKHAVERNFEIIEYISPKSEKILPQDLLPWLHPTAEELEKARNLLIGIDKPVVFGVGSRGAHKIWPVRYYQELINILGKVYSITPIFVGTAQEEKIILEVTSQLTTRSVNLVGKTDLRTLIAVLAQSKIVVGNDSGIIHLAASLNIPTLGIFGATNPKWFYPYNKKSAYVYKSFPCSPCGIQTSCRDYKCLKDISVAEVYQIIQDKFAVYLK